MKHAPFPDDEEKRIEELRKYSVLDTPADIAFDEITKLAATICGTKISLVSLIDSNRQWFKSSFGLNATETPRDVSFCGHAIMDDELFIVQNADIDVRFCDNPLVTGAPLVKFYAGAPLVTPSGHRIGTLCVIDHVEKNLSDEQINLLKSLSKHVVGLLELKLKNDELSKVQDQYLTVQNMSQTGGWELDVVSSKTVWSHEVYVIHQIPQGTPTNKIDGINFFAPHERARLAKLIQNCIDKGESYDSEFEFFDAKGNHKWVRSKARAEIDHNGIVTKIKGTFQDITQKKIADIRLREQISATEAYSNGLNKYAIVSKADLNGTITYVNEQFCKVSGYSIEELIGQNYRILNSGYHSKAFFQEMWSTISKGMQWRGEVKNKNKNGEYFWVDTTITPSLGFNGEILEYIIFRYVITEKKEIEEKLKRSEENHRLLFDQSHDPVMTLIPPLFTFGSGNPATLKLFGAKSLDQFCSLGPWDISPEFQSNGERSLDLAKIMIEKAMREGSNYFEWDHQRLDGYIIPCTVLFSRISSNDSVFLQATVRDISLQKIAQESLSRKTNELNNFFDLALNFLLISNLDGKFLKINKAWQAFGYTEQELLTMSFIDLIHPDDVEASLQEVEKLRKGIPTIHFMNRYRTKNGTYRMMSWASSPATNSDLIYAVAVDVTEQVKKDFVLSEISHIRSRFIDFGTDKVKFFKYLVRKLISITHSQCGFFGEIFENEKGKHFKPFDVSEALWGDEKAKDVLFEKINVIFRDALENGELYLSNEIGHHDLSIDISNQQVVLTKILGVPIFYAGKLIAIFGFANNKQDYDKNLLHDLQPLFESIGEMVNALEIEDQLENQKRIALQSTKLASIGLLAAGVGHEINNPLAIISGQISMAQNQLSLLGVADPIITDKFAKVDNAISRIANIVKGLRTFARSDESQILPFSFFDLLGETVGMLQDIYQKDEVYLFLNAEKQPSTVHGNRGRMQQVLVNLISNAKDATKGLKTRNIHITFSTDNGVLKFSVKDNGSGIPEEIRNKIFDPFFTTKEINMGTGIGLSLVNTIIKEHNGKIELDSKIGLGTEFTVSLPYDVNFQNDVIKPVQENAKVDFKINCNVLIVDDEEDLREILKFILGKVCTNITVASNITEAYQYFLGQEINLVISDVQMAGGDGFKLLKMIRENTTCSQPRFMFISGGVELSEGQNLIVQKQTDGFLAKPFQNKIIIDRVTELFRAK